MTRSRFGLLTLTVVLAPILALADRVAPKALPSELYATMSTTKGDIVIKLFPKQAPKTVANFVALAKGEKEFVDPATEKPTKRPFYDGVIFHRVIKDFMIQGGDPTGTGRGGPGYTFEDEFNEALTFSKPGLLAMANRGPSTNGSQFFITTSTPTHLNGKHTIFGEVVEAIAGAPVSGSKPTSDIRIVKITFSEAPPKGAAK